MDVDRYTGIPYCEDTMDCADLVVLVQRELFGREVRLPNNRPRGARGQLQVGELSKPYGERTDSPVDGDLVLMRDRGRTGHVGIYFWLAHEGWVLHTNETNACSVLHRVRELPEWGASIEGFYRWV